MRATIPRRPALSSPEQAASPAGFLREPQVLALFPIGRSTWWRGVKEGRFPAPVKLGPRTTAWRRADIDDLLARLGDQREAA